MISPHVTGTERLPVATAALMADRTAEQARELPATAEVKAYRKFNIITQVQRVCIRQVGTAYIVELRIELAAARISAVGAGISRRAATILYPQHSAISWRRRVPNFGKLSLPETALRDIAPVTLPG
jgi:hypothetical protein